MQPRATNRDQHTLCRRISPWTSLLSFAPFARKLARSTTKREHVAAQSYVYVRVCNPSRSPEKGRWVV